MIGCLLINRFLLRAEFSTIETYANIKHIQLNCTPANIENIFSRNIFSWFSRHIFAQIHLSMLNEWKSAHMNSISSEFDTSNIFLGKNGCAELMFGLWNIIQLTAGNAKTENSNFFRKTKKIHLYFLPTKSHVVKFYYCFILALMSWQFSIWHSVGLSLRRWFAFRSILWKVNGRKLWHKLKIHLKYTAASRFTQTLFFAIA